MAHRHAAVEQTTRMLFSDWGVPLEPGFISIQQKKHMLLQTGSVSRYPDVSENWNWRGHDPGDSVMSQEQRRGSEGASRGHIPPLCTGRERTFIPGVGCTAVPNLSFVPQPFY